ncbi:hypothetical protein TcasGA2_TC015872 [Tribolium castaneum]|uniref:Uncharacterized protein n=1 Tax=Tribolium castaneum TaxID=7070 RepID=D7EM35_TRICA|nr:hypothetical protein TcasGA2_TC015872 [Tribolium castaneum]
MRVNGYLAELRLGLRSCISAIPFMQFTITILLADGEEVKKVVFVTVQVEIQQRPIPQESIGCLAKLSVKRNAFSLWQFQIERQKLSIPSSEFSLGQFLVSFGELIIVCLKKFITTSQSTIPPISLTQQPDTLKTSKDVGGSAKKNAAGKDHYEGYLAKALFLWTYSYHRERLHYFWTAASQPYLRIPHC